MTEAVKPTPLDSMEALERAVSRSSERPQLLFKHSIHCGLSGMAMSEFESHLKQPAPDVDYWLLTVQTARTVSNEVETRLGIRHETPQAILVRDGRAVWNASHRGITTRSLAEATAAAT